MADILSPIVVDMGKVKKKWIKRLKRGEGKLVQEVDDIVEQIVDELGDEADGKTLVPVVILYKPKEKKRRMWCLPTLF